jgi:uncharacterized protein (DUF1778 family)
MPVRMDNAVIRTRSGSEMRQRQKLALMRCTPDEHAQLEAAANRAGLTVSAFMRHQCLGTAGPRAVRRAPVERAALSQLLAQLGKCGSNLNQIARALNRGRDEPDDTAEAIEAVEGACVAIMQALGKRPTP